MERSSPFPQLGVGRTCQSSVPGSLCSQPCPGGAGGRGTGLSLCPPAHGAGREWGECPPFSPVLLPSLVILAPQVEQSSRGMGVVEMGLKPHFQHHCSSLFVSFQSHSTAGLNYSSLVACCAGKWSG